MKTVLNLRMATRCVVLLVAILFIGQSASALNFKRKRHRQYESENLAWSVQAAVDDNVENDYFYGFRLMFMKHYNHYSAFRVGFGIGGVKTDYIQRQVYFTDGTFWGYEKGHDFDITGGYLVAQFMHYPDRHRGMNLYWGIGPRISILEPDFDKTIIYYDVPPYDEFIEIDRDDSKLLGIGIEGTVGLEWMLGRNLGLMFEYGFTLENQWLIYEEFHYYDGYDMVVDYGSIDEGVTFEAKHIKLGLAFYF